MELSQIQKEKLCMLYDNKLNDLPRLKDSYNLTELDLIKTRIMEKNEDTIAFNKSFLFKICNDLLQQSEAGCNELKEMLEFTKNVGSKLKLEVPNSAFDFGKVSLNDALFIETKYVGYFLSDHIDKRLKRPLLKVAVVKLGQNLYKFQEEIIIIDNQDFNWICKSIVNQNGKKDINEFDYSEKTRIFRTILIKLWDYYETDKGYNTEYVYNNEILVTNKNEYLEHLIVKYLIDIRLENLYDPWDFTWKKVGYKLYDNRGCKLFSDKIRTLKNQI